MKLLTTKVHACIDYLCAIIMMSSSLFFNLSPMENYALLVSGITTIIYSAFTKYEFSVLHLIRLNKHFKMDVLSGTGLIIAPWLFSFSPDAKVIFMACGGLKVIIGFITSTCSSAAKQYSSSFYKMYDMPVYGKMEKFPRMKI